MLFNRLTIRHIHLLAFHNMNFKPDIGNLKNILSPVLGGMVPKTMQAIGPLFINVRKAGFKPISF